MREQGQQARYIRVLPGSDGQQADVHEDGGGEVKGGRNAQQQDGAQFARALLLLQSRLHVSEPVSADAVQFRQVLAESDRTSPKQFERPGRGGRHGVEAIAR